MNVPCTVISRSVSYAALVICVLQALCVQSAYGQSSDAPNPEVVQLKKQMAEMQAQMEEMRDQIRTLEEARKPSVRNATFVVPTATESMPSEAIGGDAGVTTAITDTTAATNAAAQTASTPAQSERSLDIYGFAMLDAGQDFKSIDPNWYDSLRPTKLPSPPGTFGQNGNTYLSIRQTRFGVKGVEPTPWGDLKAQFEFDMYGTGKDAGVTTMRPRHFFGQLGPILAGQTNTTFMDIDVFPNNSLEYWGPNGMVFIRQPQFRIMPIQGDTHLWISLEAPGQSADLGLLSDRIAEQNVRARFRYPDLAGQYRHAASWGYLQGAAVVRNVRLDDTLPNQFDLNQSIMGWGFSFSSLMKVSKEALHLQYTFGNGIENYMNDAPVDVAPILNPGNPARPIKGKPLPMWAMVAYLDHNWSDKLATSIGYSQVQIQNTSLQAPTAYHLGQYSTASLAWYPFDRVMYGGEFQWGRRTNLGSVGANDYRLQFSFKYTFNGRIIGTK